MFYVYADIFSFFFGNYPFFFLSMKLQIEEAHAV